MPADTPIEKLALAAIDADAQIKDLTSSQHASSHIPFTQLYAYVNDPGFDMPDDFERKLADDATSQANLDRLLEKASFAFLPKQAAASSGASTHRETDAIIMTITPSRAEPDQVYLQIELKDQASPAPVHLFARLNDGPWVRQPLPAFSQSKAQLLMRISDEIVQIISAPDGEVYLR